ncbi:RNA-directed DNA polymerase, eukaryota, reverse transcriptase zinc-binding domain protein, partial [Tanacetum coccineum]
MFSIAAWNIRGLNRTPKQSEVRQEWTSNANLCTKGCRVILGWNIDVVNIMVLSQSNQAMHVKIIHKATSKIMFCSFIYVGNLPAERRLLWAELDLHKHVVRGFPWTLMGDFNVALNLEDYLSGPSCLNSAMNDVKACVNKIEVMDINSSGLHYTWNQKPGVADMSWGWRKLLQIREFVKPFFWKKLGNGKSTSLWFDRWNVQCPLINYLTPRDITNEGFTLKTCVADIVSHEGWLWPQSWLLKEPNLATVEVPNLL